MMRTFRGGLLIGLAVAVLVGALAVIYEFYDTRTLKRTVRRGEVLCGVNKGLPGFSIPDDKGNWTGFDVDFCRAVAAAIFNDPGKAKFVPLDASERFKELQSRKVDILSRNSTWSMARELDYDLYFPAVAYYDGQGFMLPRSRFPRVREPITKSCSPRRIGSMSCAMNSGQSLPSPSRNTTMSSRDCGRDNARTPAAQARP